MVKLYKQKVGYQLLIAIEGDKNEVLGQYYSLYNHEGTDEDLRWISDSLAYVTSSENRLKKYLVNSSLALILNKSPLAFKRKESGAMPEAVTLAEQRYKEIAEIDLTCKRRASYAEYQVSLSGWEEVEMTIDNQ